MNLRPAASRSVRPAESPGAPALSRRGSLRLSKPVLWALTAAAAVAVTASMAGAGEEEDYQKLGAQARSAYRAADYKKALDLSQKMHEMRPRELDPMYNIACMHCLLGEKAKAYEWLDKVVEAGWTDDDLMANDADLRTIRGEPRFRELLKKVRDRNRGGTVPQGDRGRARRPDRSGDEDRPARPATPERAGGNDRERRAGDEGARRGGTDRELSPQERERRVNELTRKVIEASEAGEREKALNLAEEALAIADIGLTNYNVACMHSLLGNKDEAFKYLDKAIDKGLGGGQIVQQMEGDSDLDNIRKDPRYAKALARAKEKYSERRDTGRQIQPKYRVTLPRNHDKNKAAPLIVAFHGLGQNMDAATERWKKAADEVGAILLAPQGTYDQGEGRISWGSNLRQIEDNVMSAIDEVMDDHKVDADRVVLVGFSQGGWVAYGLALRSPDTFRGIIPVAGRFASDSPGAFEDKAIKKLRVCILVGADDRDALVEGNKDAAERFQKAGAKVKLNVYDDVGHDFPRNAVEEQVRALKFVLD